MPVVGVSKRPVDSCFSYCSRSHGSPFQKLSNGQRGGGSPSLLKCSSQASASASGALVRSTGPQCEAAAASSTASNANVRSRSCVIRDMRRMERVRNISAQLRSYLHTRPKWQDKPPYAVLTFDGDMVAQRDLAQHL